MPVGRFTLVGVLLISSAAVMRADEPLHDRIDALIAAGSRGDIKRAAPRASDAEFLRRVYLDLNGTIPSSAEARAFLADTDPNKRARIIDTLLARPAYARHMALVFDVVLMERRRDVKVPRAAWEEYLRNVFAQKRPYDVFVRELLSADGVDPKKRAEAKFFLDRDFEPNRVTRDIGRIFLGRDMQCAQCHDHPHINDYKQADYYGILAFLNRSYLFPKATAANAVLAEKADGEVSFTSVFDKSKKQGTTLPRVLGGTPFPEKSLPKGKEYRVAPTAKVGAIPVYSRREKLANAITSSENPAFARTAVNRLWEMMLGRGIVHPVDLDHAANPPSHPALLDLLAAEFADHHFDVAWLLSEIAMSKTYQRSSAIPTGNADSLPPERFLVANLRPLSAEQLAYAASQATGQTDADRLSLGKKATDAAVDDRIARRLAPFRKVFAAQPGEPEDRLTTTLPQTLFLKFGPTLRTMLPARAGNLADRLVKLKSDEAVAEELFLSVLTRRPSTEEQQDVANMLAQSPNRTTAISELIWALIASAEFRFNH